MPALLFQPLASASQPAVILKSANEMCPLIGGFGDTEVKWLSRRLAALGIRSKETRLPIGGSGGEWVKWKFGLFTITMH